MGATMTTAIKNIPVLLEGYKLLLVAPPSVKMKQDKNGNDVPALAWDGSTLFVASVFIRQRPTAEVPKPPKGGEITVTLDTDPGDAFTEDMQVAFIDPRVSHYEMPKDNGGVNSGISWKARGMVPAAAAAPAGRRPAPSGGEG